MKLALAVATAATVLIACSSGSDKGGTASTVREPRDPRTVPTATAPAQVPTPIPAVDVSQPQRRPTTLPDVYIVKAGDTPAGIAAELGVDLGELLRINGIDDPRGLRVGQQLRVPRPSPTPAPTRPGATPAGARTATPAGTATAARTPTVAGATATATATRTPTATTTATRTPTPAATATASPGAGGTYTVQAGDTACDIATRLGVPLSALAEANNTTVEALASLQIGQTLRVPATRGPSGC
jgi:LysM repeat protein